MDIDLTRLLARRDKIQSELKALDHQIQTVLRAEAAKHRVPYMTEAHFKRMAHATRSNLG